MEPYTSTIRQFSGPIRDHVNKPWKHYLLRQDHAMFSQLCSSMDMVDDADDAITAFRLGLFDDSKSGLYLATWGVLQALVVQQDATAHLSEALGYDVAIFSFPELREVREIRHLSFGHPTKKKQRRSNEISYNHIIQVSLAPSGFELLSFLGNGTPNHRYVDLHRLIAAHTDAIATILQGLLTRLIDEQRRHVARFSEETLTTLFHPSIDYHASKITEAAYQDDEPDFGLINLRTVIAALDQFREAVGRRNRDFYDSLEHEFRLVHHAADMLTTYFQARASHSPPPIAHESAQIFAEFTAAQVRTMVGYAREIDKDYEEQAQH